MRAIVRRAGGVLEGVIRIVHHVRDVHDAAIERRPAGGARAIGAIWEGATYCLLLPREAVGSEQRQRLTVEADECAMVCLAQTSAAGEMALKIGPTSVGEREITRRISLVAVCCSSASARRLSRSRSPECSLFDDLRTTGRSVSTLVFARLARRPINLSLPPTASDRPQARRGGQREQGGPA
jgi:hypothetical protein